jgi:hypothetical protein
MDSQTWLLAVVLMSFWASAVGAQEDSEAWTRVTIENGQWHINGRVTYPGTRAEGLLMNVRMVNAVFEDRRRAEFDPEANTDRFLARMPDYAAHGVRAFTSSHPFQRYAGRSNPGADCRFKAVEQADRLQRREKYRGRIQSSTTDVAASTNISGATTTVVRLSCDSSYSAKPAAPTLPNRG